MGVLAFFNGLVGFFGIRLIRKYDEQIRELFERTKDLPAVRESIRWLEKASNGRKK
jgi:hypothetical protein